MITEHDETYMHLIQWGAVLCTSLVAALWDIRTRRIPNKLTFPFLLAGLVWSTYISGAWGFLEAFAAALLLSIPFLVLYAFAGGGAGDVKLMAGLGAWLGLSTGFTALIFIILSGGVMGCMFAAYKGQLRPIFARIRELGRAMVATLLFNKGKGFSGAAEVWVDPKSMVYMPYGFAIFCGVCLSATGTSLWPF